MRAAAPSFPSPSERHLDSRRAQREERESIHAGFAQLKWSWFHHCFSSITHMRAHKLQRTLGYPSDSFSLLHKQISLQTGNTPRKCIRLPMTGAEIPSGFFFHLILFGTFPESHSSANREEACLWASAPFQMATQDGDPNFSAMRAPKHQKDKIKTAKAFGTLPISVVVTVNTCYLMGFF